MQSAHGKVTSTIILHPKKHKLGGGWSKYLRYAKVFGTSQPATFNSARHDGTVLFRTLLLAALALRDESAWDKPSGTQLSCCSRSVCGPARGKSSLNHKRAITTGPSTATTEQRQPLCAREINPTGCALCGNFLSDLTSSGCSSELETAHN